MLECKPKSDSAVFPDSRANNSGCSGFDLSHYRTHPRPYGHIYVVDKFGTDWSIFADARV